MLSEELATPKYDAIFAFIASAPCSHLAVGFHAPGTSVHPPPPTSGCGIMHVPLCTGHVDRGSDFLKVYNWYFGYLDELYTVLCH